MTRVDMVVPTTIYLKSVHHMARMRTGAWIDMSFENGKDLAEYAVQKARDLGAEFAEARFEQLAENSFMLRNGNPEISLFTRTQGLGIRVLAEGGIAFTSTNSLEKKDIEDAVKLALRLARANRKHRSRDIKLADVPSVNATYKVPAKLRPSDVSSEEKAKRTLTLDKILAETGTPFRMMFMRDYESRKYLYTSDGIAITSFTPRIGAFFMLTQFGKNGPNQRFIQVGGTGGWELIDEWKLEQKIKEEAIILEKIANDAKKAPEGTLDFVIGSEVVGIICHENVGHPSEADRILGREGAQAGESYMTPEMLGQEVASEVVTIIDDPTIPKSAGYYEYDDEGVKARPRYLIKNGVFTEMLHNRESAFLLNTESTGAARASAFKREPIPRMANTYMAEGDHSFEEIFEDIKLGIYMKSYTEWNIDDRRYQSKYVGFECYLIKDGELTDTLVFRPALETTTPGLLKSIDACSKGLDFVAATCGKSDPMQGAPVWKGGSLAVRIRNVPFHY